MREYTTAPTPLQIALHNAEQMLSDLDLQFAIVDAHLAARGIVPQTMDMLVTDCAQTVAEVTHGQSVQWAAGYEHWKPSLHQRYAAIVTRTGVIVWQCDQRGGLHTLIGVVTTEGFQPNEQLTDWRQRQERTRKLSYALGMEIA